MKETQKRKGVNAMALQKGERYRCPDPARLSVESFQPL